MDLWHQSRSVSGTTSGPISHHPSAAGELRPASWPVYGRDEVNTEICPHTVPEVGWRLVSCCAVGAAGRRLRDSRQVQGMYETLPRACRLQAVPESSASLSHLYGDHSLVSDTSVVRREILLGGGCIGGRAQRTKSRC